jgi:hypothetical protein
VTYDGDDDMMAGLRRAADQLDPVPDLVLRAARAALSTRRMDDELAALLMDSELVTPGQVRAAGDDVRLLSFETEQVSIELQVEHIDGLISLRGLVSGASGEAVIEATAERRAVPIDDEGWFVTNGLPRGATRVRVTADSGAPTTTGWVLL